MANRMALVASLVLMVALGACAAEDAPGPTSTSTPVPVVTPSSQVQPQPTVLPASPVAPSPSEAPEAIPAGEAGEETIGAAAIRILASALGIDPTTIQVASIEPVEWPDSCLGVTVTDQACLEVITPGYRVVLEVDGLRYAVHTNKDGSVARFAGPAEEPAGMAPGTLGMAWQSPGEPCQTATITFNSVAVGACDGPQKDVPMESPDLIADLTYYTGIYASFEAQTPAGSLFFSGAGPAVATPAEQRMMAVWARLASAQVTTRPSDAPRGLVLAWHREGGFAGFCDDLATYASGYGRVSSCQTEPPAALGKRWLTAGQASQLFGWTDMLASFEYGQKDPAVADAMSISLAFSGDGAGEATEQDRQAMLDFSAWLATYGAQATSVRYIAALADLPVTDGPGTQFETVGNIFAGQIAFVTGASPDQQWWRVICADGTVDNCWVPADPTQTQPAEPPGQPAVSATPPPWNPPDIYATVIRQLITVDHTFGQAPTIPVVYLVRQTSANAADPAGSGSSETIFPGDQQRIVSLLGDLPSQFVWVDRVEDVPREDQERVADGGAIVQVGSISPQDDGSLHVPGSIYFGPLVAGGQTYILQPIDGVWQITGKSGPVWMS